VVANVVRIQDNAQVVHETVLMNVVKMVDMKLLVETPVPMLSPTLCVKEQRHADHPRNDHTTLPSPCPGPTESKRPCLIRGAAQECLSHCIDKVGTVPQGEV